MQTSRRPQFEMPTLPLGIAAPCQLHPALAAEDLPTVQLPAATVDPELSIETQKFQAVCLPSWPDALPGQSPRHERGARCRVRDNRTKTVPPPASIRTLGVLVACAILGVAVGCVAGWLAASGFRV